MELHGAAKVAEPNSTKKTGTRRSVKKSRGGCSRCKSQHIKCDEARPRCGRCERLSMKCPGYATKLRWSTRHEMYQNDLNSTPAAPTFSADDYGWLDFNLPQAAPSTLGTPASNDFYGSYGMGTTLDLSERPVLDIWNATEVTMAGDTEPQHDVSRLLPMQSHFGMPDPFIQAWDVQMRPTEPQLPITLTNQPYELIQYYFKVVPGIYSTFDNHKNPFRAEVRDRYSDSLAVNLAAQSMAAAYLAESHPRFAQIGTSLRQQCLDLVGSESSSRYDELLAMIMSGPTGNWHDHRDLGLKHYDTMRTRLTSIAAAGQPNKDLNFFSEAMVLWEMFLAFAADSDHIPRSNTLSPTDEHSPTKKEVHPWTGVGGNILRIIAEIGRLVRANRIRSQNQKFITQKYIEQMSQDLAQARELERRLLGCRYLQDRDVVDTEDIATPVWHITTIAQLHRYAGLLQLYKVFPDLITDRLLRENSVASTSFFGLTHSSVPNMDHPSWLRAFSMEALRQLETIPDCSGTKDFQPFLLVVFASELACDDQASSDDHSSLTFSAQETTCSTAAVEVALMRKFVLDRLTLFCRQIPPKPLRVCLDIIKETWRRLDSGQKDAYWLDVMIEKGRETIMA